MKKFFRRRAEDGAAVGFGGESSATSAPLPAQEALASTGPTGNAVDGDPLSFLPPARPGATNDHGNGAAFASGQPLASGRLRKGDDIAGLPMPGAMMPSRLAGLFDDDDQAAPALSRQVAPAYAAAAATTVAVATSPRSEPPTLLVSAAAPVAQGQAAWCVWTGSGSLFRLDDGGTEMVEVDAGEGRGGLVGAVVRFPQPPGRAELLIYTAARKRARLRCDVSTLEPQPPSGESAAFYDEHGIYWALQLGSSAEAAAFTRALLAVRAFESGHTESVELRAGFVDAEGAENGTKASSASVSCKVVKGTFWELSASGGTEEMVPGLVGTTGSAQGPSDAQYGAGVADAISSLRPGAAVLVAVPAPVVSSSLRRGDNVVLLLEVEAVSQAATEAARASAPSAGQVANATGSSEKESIIERVARLGVPGLGPPPLGAVNHAATIATAPISASAPAFAMPTVASAYSQGSAFPSAVAPALPPSGIGGSPSRPSMSNLAATAMAGMTSHPSAEIIRQYWEAVQNSAPPGAPPFAYLGAVPAVPGLTLHHQQLHSQFQHQQQLQQQHFQEQHRQQMLQARQEHGKENPHQLEHQQQHQREHQFLLGQFGAAGTEQRSFPQKPPMAASVSAGVNAASTSLLGSVTFGDLIGAMREVVRAEATPEGWQAERQKLERKVSLLEDQLRSARTHQEQLLEAHRAQTAALHAQLADAQLAAHQMRDQQLRSDSERQLREWQKDAAHGAIEAELQQCRSEVQQLRMEERGLRDRLAEAEAARQRAEGAQANAAATAAVMPGLQAKVREQEEIVAQLRAALTESAEARLVDAAAICKNALAIVYVAIQTSLLGSGAAACVAAEAAAARVRAICQRCGRAVEQQLQAPQGEQLNWETIEASVLGVGTADALLPLPPVEAGPSELQRAEEERLRAELDGLRPELDHLRSQLADAERRMALAEQTEREAEEEAKQALVARGEEASRRELELESQVASSAASVEAARAAAELAEAKRQHLEDQLLEQRQVAEVATDELRRLRASAAVDVAPVGASRPQHRPQLFDLFRDDVSEPTASFLHPAPAPGDAASRDGSAQAAVDAAGADGREHDCQGDQRATHPTGELREREEAESAPVTIESDELEDSPHTSAVGEERPPAPHGEEQQRDVPESESRRKKEEEQRHQQCIAATEEARRQEMEEEQRRAAVAEEERRRAAEEEQQLLAVAAEEEQRRLAMEAEEEQRRLAMEAEEQQRRLAMEAEEEKRRALAAEEERRRVAEEEEQRRAVAVEEERHRQLEEEQRRTRAAEEERHRAAEEERQRRAAAADEERRRALEEEERRRAAEDAREEEERRKREELEEQQRLAAKAAEEQRRCEEAERQRKEAEAQDQHKLPDVKIAAKPPDRSRLFSSDDDGDAFLRGQPRGGNGTTVPAKTGVKKSLFDDDSDADVVASQTAPRANVKNPVAAAGAKRRGLFDDDSDGTAF